MEKDKQKQRKCCGVKTLTEEQNIVGALGEEGNERAGETDGVGIFLSSRPQTLSLSHHSASIDPRTQ